VEPSTFATQLSHMVAPMAASQTLLTPNGHGPSQLFSRYYQKDKISQIMWALLPYRYNLLIDTGHVEYHVPAPYGQHVSQ
jgi:hypothetical protein